MASPQTLGSETREPNRSEEWWQTKTDYSKNPMTGNDSVSSHSGGFVLATRVLGEGSVIHSPPALLKKNISY